MVARTRVVQPKRGQNSISSGFLRPVVKPEGKHLRSRGLPAESSACYSANEPNQ